MHCNVAYLTLWTAAVSLGIAAPRAASGQVSLELGPLVAAYAPLGAFGPYDATSTAYPTRPGDLAGVAWGAEGRVWFNSRVGVQVQGAVATSRFGGGVFLPNGFTTSPSEAQVVTVTAQVVYRPLAGRLPLLLTAGAGVVSHQGDAYSWPTVQGLSAPAVALGLGFELPISRRLAATFGVTALLYSLDVHDEFGQRYEHGFQTDLIPYVSLAWRSRRP